MLLKNGYLIDPASNTDELMDIRVENGTIVELGKDLSAKDEEEILDLSGLTVAPGLIDTHIHFRDPGLTYKEDLHTGSLAAAKGGFTSVICMANTKPAVDSVDTLKDILTRAQDENIHISTNLGLPVVFKDNTYIAENFRKIAQRVEGL